MTDTKTLWLRANAAADALASRSWDEASAMWNRWLAWCDRNGRTI